MGAGFCRTGGEVDGHADAEVDVVVRISGDRDPERRRTGGVLRLFRMEPRRDAALAHLRLAAEAGLQPGASLCADDAGLASICRAGRIDRDHAVRLVAQLHGLGKPVVHEVERLAQLRLEFFLICHLDLLLMIGMSLVYHIPPKDLNPQFRICVNLCAGVRHLLRASRTRRLRETALSQRPGHVRVDEAGNREGLLRGADLEHPETACQRDAAFNRREIRRPDV